MASRSDTHFVLVLRPQPSQRTQFPSLDFSSHHSARKKRRAWIVRCGYEHVARAIMRSRALNHRLWATHLPIVPLACSLGSTRNYTTGPMITPGRTTKVMEVYHQRGVALILFAVLTWVSIFWFSRAGPAASLRIYFELENSKEASDLGVGPKIPMGASFFPKEIVIVPKA
jgi:hypothetical protein